MHRVRLAVAVLLVAMGCVWVGQGLGFIPGSFMTGDRIWAGAGAVAVAVGGFLAWDAVRRR
jgi:uncharacterized membrane protein